MGNSATKEQRPPPQHLRSGHLRRSSSPLSSPTSPTSADNGGFMYGARHGRGSRSDLSSFLRLGNTVEGEATGLETRKETKAEREARKLEKERVLREAERERSMREENVDGGYLVTQGVYTGTEDYNKAVVRQLMVERRIAPFWRGLNDHSASWTEHQLVAAARGLPIPAPDEIPLEEAQRSFQYPSADANPKVSDQNINNLTVPITSRTPSYNSDSSSVVSPIQPNFSLPSNTTSGLLRGRAKTMASLTTSSKNTPGGELIPREMNLPKDPYVNGQPIEAYLYKDASECPICFLYYPPHLNRTRCCDQAICSECFVQIKRPDPHPPEHVDPTAPRLPPTEHPEPADLGSDTILVSEPAACPFCVQPEFGITYDQPPFRRGLTYVNQLSSNPLANASSAMSSQSSLGSFTGSGSLPNTTRRRTQSLSVNAPSVITTDRVRPDWATKLANARAQAARRSAAATALHTAAYLMGRNGSPDARGFGGFGRRVISRRGTGEESPSGASSSSHLNMLALMTERYATAPGAREGRTSPTMIGPPRGSSRRNRMDDLEDMMMMEAIRLSLASEEDRRKKEEKDAKKVAKKKSKEEKKAEKAARKAGLYPSSSNQSSGTLESPQSGTFPFDVGKGKGTQREDTAGLSDLDLASSSQIGKHPFSTESAQTHLEKSRAQLMPSEALLPSNASLYAYSSHKPSHLRNLSNVSSSTSSLAESHHISGSHSSFDASPNASGILIPRAADVQESLVSATPPGGGAGMEPMFNFRSLAAMIDNDERADADGPPRIDHADLSDPSGSAREQLQSLHQQGESSSSGRTGVEQEGSVFDSETAIEQSTETLTAESAHGKEITYEAEPDIIDEFPPRPMANAPIMGSDMALKQREANAMSSEESRCETGGV